MNCSKWIMGTLAAAALPVVQADVPELLELVPEAKGYELIAQLDPRNYHQKGYAKDYLDGVSGKVERVGYLMKLTDKQDQTSWVFVSMDAFSDKTADFVVPSDYSPTIQKYVTNLEVAGNSPAVKNGKFEKGNIEFWPNNYGGGNRAKIPGASDRSYDFGDSPDNNLGYGSMQVHNYLEKQTVFAFNAFRGNTPDIGIGSQPKGNPDWTFARNGKNYKAAELFIVAKGEGLKVTPVTAVNPDKIAFQGAIVNNKMNFAPGEEMKFQFHVTLPKEADGRKFFLTWTRSGDDGVRQSGREEIVSGKPITLTAKSDKPGFVRIEARVVNAQGKVMKRSKRDNKQLYFDGGAGVQVETLTQAVPEPADFDAFWENQKKRLAAVPVKAEMKEVLDGEKAKVYEVTVDCAGPRPVTGYLAIPKAPGKYPATVQYQGYSVPVARCPKWLGNSNRIVFAVNAHGYKLSQPDAYYKAFSEEIKSNGKGYAFDPKENADAEKSYFNGMALRVMRSLQYVKTLPQWNGKDLLVEGGSQGGLQTAWAAGLDGDVTEARPFITWCCDFGGEKVGKRLGGWRPEYVPALNYYDAVNHAKRIKCPVTVTRAGLGDYVCPPSGLAAFYNAIKTPKKIIWVQGSQHGYVPDKAQKFVDEAK